MPIIKVRGVEMDVDITSELSEFTWTKPKWTYDKLIAASPFRYDSTPSFFVSLEHGGWTDSGAYDQDYESGGFAKLLAFLRDETYEETCEYLFELYAPTEDFSGRIEIPEITLRKPKRRITLDSDILTELAYRSTYLGKRGISEKVQRFMGVGFTKKSQAISMPWFHADGTLANVKYRKTQGKTFWYERGAAPIRTLVYGIDKVYRHNLTEVVVCEAEIDAMTWMESGKPAVAIGGTAVSDTQIDLIRKSPIERLIIAQDNDKAGGKLREVLTQKLRGNVEVSEVAMPSDYKDANDALLAGVDLGGIAVTPIQQPLRLLR